MKDHAKRYLTNLRAEIEDAFSSLDRAEMRSVKREESRIEDLIWRLDTGNEHIEIDPAFREPLMKALQDLEDYQSRPYEQVSPSDQL